jgi:peptidoglycan/LPS O-acetylase OafA/YrhL
MKPRYVVIGLFFLFISLFIGLQLFTLWVPTFGAYILFYLVSLQRSPFKQFGRFGDFSYGLYIYAFPVQQSLAQLAGGNIQPMLNLALALPITLILAALSWHVVEKPALRLKHVPFKLSQSHMSSVKHT